MISWRAKRTSRSDSLARFQLQIKSYNNKIAGILSWSYRATLGRKEVTSLKKKERELSKNSRQTLTGYLWLINRLLVLRLKHEHQIASSKSTTVFKKQSVLTALLPANLLCKLFKIWTQRLISRELPALVEDPQPQNHSNRWKVRKSHVQVLPKGKILAK